jgi:hemerythrin-like domain-containing protein
MHGILEKLKKDHRNLERILDLLTTQLDRFFAGEESDFDLKCELLEYLESYADQGHHPLEELIYQVALPRVGEKRELLERLQEQHQRLIQATRQFRRSLQNVLQGGVMSRDELEVEGREYIALQRLHIDLEEDEAFPLLDARLTEAEWKQIAARMPQQVDPVFERPDQVRFRHLVEYLAQAGGAG